MNIRNGAAYLREAIDSVVAQTYSDWELIAWDDCSTDNSPAIIAAYHDSRIKYFRAAEPVSLGTARDRAIREAHGKWLAFLDQDDIWLPHKLEKQLLLAASEVGIIYGRTVVFYPDGRRRDYDVAHEFLPLPEGDVFNLLFARACFIAMSSVMLTRRAIEEIGGIPDTVNLVPDYYLYTAIARSYRARAVQEVVCLYRMHATNLSQERDPRLYMEPLTVVNQWAHCLPAELVSYRRKSYASVLALNELRHHHSFLTGLKRLLAQGSLLWLVQRPFVHFFRAFRRKIQCPYWKRVSSNPASAPPQRLGPSKEHLGL